MTQDQINHQMLSQIAGYVAEFCQDDEMTTEEAVRWVVASYKKLLAEKELGHYPRINSRACQKQF